MGQYCCKSKKKEVTEKEKEALKQLEEMFKEKKLEDYIEQAQFNKTFENYCSTNFDMKNLPKYLEDEANGIFSFDFILKIFLTSFLFKNLVFDQLRKPLISERRKHLREAENNAYKETFNKMEEFEDKIFQSCLDRTKKHVQILEENFNKSLQKHIKSEENKKRLNKIEEVAHSHFMAAKSDMLQSTSNITNMGRNEALRVQKELQSLQLEQMKEFYEIQKEQRKEEFKYLQPML